MKDQVFLIDVSHCEMIKRVYGKEYRDLHKRAQICYHFDKVFCSILNQIGLNSDIPQLALYQQAIYSERDKHFVQKLKEISDTLDEEEKIVFICGSNHAGNLIKSFDKS